MLFALANLPFNTFIVLLCVNKEIIIIITQNATLSSKYCVCNYYSFGNQITFHVLCLYMYIVYSSYKLLNLTIIMEIC